MPGLLVVRSNDQIEDDAEAERNEFAPPEPVLSPLVGAVHAAWDRNKRARTEIDQELLRCLRQVKGEYDPEEQQLIAQQGGGNDVYMMLTATKVAAAQSWIQDVILPVDDLPVGAEATEIPELPSPVYAELVQKVVAQAEQEMRQGDQPLSYADISERIDEIEADVRQRVNRQARERADRMTQHLQDTLQEGGFRTVMEQFIDDFCTYPTAILKGPIYRRKPQVEWSADWQPQVTHELQTTFERVSPFDAYPAPGAETTEDGDFIERMRMDKAQIYALLGNDDYRQDAVQRVLSDHASGQLHHWLWTDTERADLENKGNYHQTDDGLIDALHFWGYIDGKALIEWGMDGDLDPLKPYPVEALVIGSECLRCAVIDDPLQRRPYQAASMYSKPGAFWGESLPKRMRHTQKMCNAVARSLADNLSVSSGPQAVVNLDALADGEDVTNIYPWKIWQASFNPDSAGTSKPVDFFQPSSNAAELLPVYNEFEQRADNETGIPRYSYGDEETAGAGQTASGLSMLFDAASKGVRRSISHIDAGVMRPLVEKLWMEEMRHGDDEGAKGDMDIVPRGAAALLIADQAQQRRAAFLQQTVNPVDMQIIGLQGRAEVLREFAKSLDMPVDKIIPSREEIAQQQKAQAQQVDPDHKEAMAKLQLEREKAQHEAQHDQAQLALDQAKAVQDARHERAELTQKTRDDQHDNALERDQFKLDIARYLAGEEERMFQRRMGLQGPDGDDSTSNPDSQRETASQSGQ